MPARITSPLTAGIRRTDQKNCGKLTPPELARLLTPPQLARQLGVSPEKVIGWINRGDLRGLNLAKHLGGRPRYRITPEAVQEFLRSREVTPVPKSPRRTKRPDGDWVEFY
jgi:hypothetical protein